MKRAIKTHLVDFVAIIVLLVLSIVVAGYVLTQERLRFPFFSTSQFTLNADFSTAQAVTPGQGQSVRVSGVQIGDIAAVTLKNGDAIVRMNIDEKYRHLIHPDATALLRPRTGLKDMFVEVNPGSPSAPVANAGFTIPVSNTMPDINADEVLASLDADTRSYLQLLINGAGQGLANGGGKELAGVFQRFLPTHQALARLNGAVSVRGRNLQRLVNSLARLNTALGEKRFQIEQLVSASAQVFSATAADDLDIQRAIADLPGTLEQTTATLAKVQTLANVLGPAATNLLPFARALPAANAALKSLAIPATPIVQNQIRPFVIAARPTIRQLRPAAINLAAATPNLGRVFTVFNHLVNMLGYYPTQSGLHGYLWWLAWLDHNARTLFSIQDANGDFRPLFLQATCGNLAQIANNVPGSGAVLNITTILSSAGLCPTQAKALKDDYAAYKAGKAGGASTRSGAADGTSGQSGAFLPKLPTN